jgi:hypothetical protein
MKKLLLFLAALIGGPVLIIGGMGEYKESKQLQAEGKVVTAQVVDAKETRGRKGRVKYWLTVDYQPEQGPAHQATSQVSHSRFNRAVAEKSVAIVYLPAKPQVFQFGERAETRYGSVVVGSILTVGALGFMGFLFFAHRSSKGGSTNLSPQSMGIPAKPQEPMGIPAKPTPAPAASDDLQKAA